MINLKILLNELKEGKCNSLYKYDQFIANKVFEYAINDPEYISNLNNISGFENMKLYNPKHEQLIIVACKTCINQKNIYCYKIFYNKYLEFKSKFMAWRGRLDWFYFHKLLFSHFIWHNNFDILLWTWNKKMDYCKNFRKKYTMISDWRRKWYMNEIKNLRCYMIEVSILANKMNIIKFLIDNKIIKINKYIQKIFTQYGYNCNEKGTISEATFYDSPEWNYICYREDNISIVNLKKCINICYQSNCNKNRIFELFNKKESIYFWEFFIDIKTNELKIITSKFLANLLNLSVEKYTIINQKFANKIIIKLFNLFNNIKPCLILAIYKCININNNIDINLIYNIVYKCIKNNKNITHINYYNNFRLLCNLFIHENQLIPINTNNEISFLETNILYHIFGNRIKNLIQFKIDKIKKSQIIDVCAICLDNINSDECFLFCGHSYHKNCIRKDLQIHNTNNILMYKCPICRVNYDANLINLLL